MKLLLLPRKPSVATLASTLAVRPFGNGASTHARACSGESCMRLVQQGNHVAPTPSTADCGPPTHRRACQPCLTSAMRTGDRRSSARLPGWTGPALPCRCMPCLGGWRVVVRGSAPIQNLSIRSSARVAVPDVHLHWGVCLKNCSSTVRGRCVPTGACSTSRPVQLAPTSPGR